MPDASAHVREIALPDEVATTRLGAAIEARLQVGDTVCLSGPLGAGKTSLARGLIRAATTADEPVPSPTFTLVQPYEGRRFPIAHFDLYRLERAADVEELGLHDALDDGAVVIEWPERLGGGLPVDRLTVEIDFAETGRIARLTGSGAWRTRVVELEV